MNRRSILNVLLIAALTFAASPTSRAEGIDRQLQRQLPRIVEYLNSRGHQTVGVLKFRVRKHGQKTSDSVGPLNSLLADRLEVGLILNNPFDKARQLLIIRDASGQATKNQAANHLSAQGRSAFFESEYQLAWGDERRNPDAFLTGIVEVHQDNTHCTIGILCFDNSGGELERCCDVIEADLDASSMSELGESFVLRGAFDGGSTALTKPVTVKQQEVVKQAHAVKTQLAKFPLVDSSAPVRLEIRYDGQLVPIETRDGRAFLAEPTQGQKVEMAIVRNPSAKGMLGIVLRVNGENTLGRETVSDLQSRKWLLTGQHIRTVIKGYQVGQNQAETFDVLSAAESSNRSINYGRFVGQIQMTVFQEGVKNPNDLPLSLSGEDEEDLVAMRRGTQPKSVPPNLSALKGQIRTAGSGATTRGLIVAGSRTDNRIRTLEFEPDPTPVMSATITYYSPR